MSQSGIRAPSLRPSASYAGGHSSAELYGWTCENVLSPAWERVVRRRPTIDHLQSLEATQWLAPEELESLQLAKLRSLLAYAGQNVPYYRELFTTLGFYPSDLRSRGEMAQLPLLTKDIIRERYRDLVDPAHAGLNLKKGTSGSTGQPLKFEYCRESHAWREATKIRGYRWGGYRMGLPTLHYWAQVHELPKGAAGLKIKLDRAVKRETFIDSMRQDEEAMLHAVDLLRRTNPNVIVCYTQSCAQWARFILDRQLRDWADIPLICGAEAVLPADREAISRAFGPEIFETYGSRETMLMASECRAHDGMHLSEENLLVEITGDGAPGTPGDVVVTDLHNYGMPFIRYVNGDVATLHGGSTVCACGRGLRRLERVEGRRADMLLDRDGNEIPGVIFHVLFSDARKEVIKQFQVIQKPSREIVFKVVRGQDWDEAAFARIVARLAPYLRGLPLTIEHCQWIPVLANGKRRTVIVEKLGGKDEQLG